MNYWYVWPIGIAIWLAVGWIDFAIFEKHGLAPTRPNQITLSLFCYTVAAKFPLAIFWAGLMIGLFFGTLSTHFLWHWCPPGSISAG